jgi:hypothetical protein
LPESVNSVETLLLGRRVPGRVQKVEAARSSQIEADAT